MAVNSRGGGRRAFTSFLVNFGEWSFLSSIMIVAVAVPVNPTSSPAMSWASMINSYLGFSRVYKAKTQQTRWHLGLGCHLEYRCRGGLCTPPPRSGQASHTHWACTCSALLCLWNLSNTRLSRFIDWTQLWGCNLFSVPILRGHSIHSRLFHFQALGIQCMFDVYTHLCHFTVTSWNWSTMEVKYDDETGAKMAALRGLVYWTTR